MIDQLEWKRFDEETPENDRAIYVTDYEIISIYSREELPRCSPSDSFHAWVYVPMPEIPIKSKKITHFCSSGPLNLEYCKQIDDEKLILCTESRCIPINFCPFCGYGNLEHNSRLKKLIDEAVESKLQRLQKE